MKEKIIYIIGDIQVNWQQGTLWGKGKEQDLGRGGRRLKKRDLD